MVRAYFYLFGIIGIADWVVGYVLSRDKKRNRTSEYGPLVKPPYWVFLICGTPKASNIPFGAMPARSIFAQLNGFAFIIIGFATASFHLEQYWIPISILFFVVLIVTNRYIWLVNERLQYKEN